MKPPGWRLPAESKREVERIRRVQGLVSGGRVDEDPATRRMFSKPVQRLSEGEQWKKRKRKDGTRAEGYDVRDVWRQSKGSPDAGKFAKKITRDERLELIRQRMRP